MYKLLKYASSCLYCGHPKQDEDYDFCSWECSEAYSIENKQSGYETQMQEKGDNINADQGFSQAT